VITDCRNALFLLERQRVIELLLDPTNRASVAVTGLAGPLPKTPCSKEQKKKQSARRMQMPQGVLSALSPSGTCL
jgi:hypothetical protein